MPDHRHKSHERRPHNDNDVMSHETMLRLLALNLSLHSVSYFSMTGSAVRHRVNASPPFEPNRSISLGPRSIDAFSYRHHVYTEPCQT